MIFIKLKFYFFLTIILSSAIGLAQAQSTIAVGSPVERSSPLREKKKPEGSSLSTVYLNDEWTVATFDLTPGSSSLEQIKDIPMRLDLQTNAFEVKSPDGIKELEASKVEKFYFKNPKTGTTEMFFNVSKFKLNGVPMVGFCKVTGNKVGMANCTSTKIVRANYDPVLNVGNKEDALVKITNLYLVKDGNFFPATKKNCFDLMADKEVEIKKFIKEERINLNKEEGWSSIVAYYDSM
jgi:hypothetical protein